MYKICPRHLIHKIDMSLFRMTEDKSIIGPGDNILFFSLDRFIKDICEGNGCFICGTPYDVENFNEEHILPDWILRKYNLHSKSIMLANQAGRLYGTYKIPCCKKCNSDMSEVLESPISELISKGFNAVNEYLKAGGYWHLFRWFNLIFLKTHLKDKSFGFHLDRRKGDEKISDSFSWAAMHHIHCVARSFYTTFGLASNVFGSFFVLPAAVGSPIEEFDYRDITHAQTLLLRLGDVAFIVVLNDSCAAWNVYSRKMSYITAPLTPLQLREWLTHAAYINMLLVERPIFHTEFDSKKNNFLISARLPDKLELQKSVPEEFGELLYFNTKDLLSQMNNSDIDQIMEEVRQGRRTFLFKENDELITNSMVFEKREP